MAARMWRRRCCWLRVVDGVKLSALDWVGAGVALVGMLIIVSGWRAA